MSWIDYASKMSINEINEVDCQEFSLTRGDCHVRCLMLEKTSENTFVFSIEKPVSLVHMEDAEYEVDEDGRYLPIEEVNGEAVLNLFGDYFCGYDTEPFPNEDNKIECSDFEDPKINEWLGANGWSTDLQKISPERRTTLNY
jgi:hypothetical protein